MCTAISFRTRDHYFGRNLDLEYHYSETVTITPRNYPFTFRHLDTTEHHYALIGMATVVNEYPLYYDATNEKGLSMAGLNFPGFAHYFPRSDQLNNVAPFELIPWILGTCATTEDAVNALHQLSIIAEPFSDHFPLSPLHWIISDKTRSITLEVFATGMRIHENPIGVLTNNPPFDYQLLHLADYMNIHAGEATNRFAPEIPIYPYSRGLNTMGLPGDLSSASRFVRASFTKMNSVCDRTEVSSVSQFFHILGNVAQQRGLVTHENAYEITYYSSCCNTDKGIYYYTTYENQQITAVDMHAEDLESHTLVSYPLVLEQQIRWINRHK